MAGNYRADSIAQRVASRHQLSLGVPLVAGLATVGRDMRLSSPVRVRPSQAISLKARRVGEVALLCVLLLASCLFVREVLFESFFIPSASMTPTLQTRDRVVVTKLAYGLQLPGAQRRVITWDSPRRGEVVVFTRKDDPSTQVDESARSMVKRVIGVSGDTVTLSGSRVLINGNPLTEPYARWSKAHALESRSFTVPQGGLFVLGDNRDESADSRYWSEPFIEENRVIGPVAVVY